MSTLLEQFVAEVNRHFFLREFSFGKNQFQSACGSELELADHLIRLPDALFLFQIKERSEKAATDETSVSTWFHRKVLDKGCGQIADSIRFLRSEPTLRVQNQRGHVHDLAGVQISLIPIILYSSGSTLPAEIEGYKHRVSKRAGFVHLMHIKDYYYLCRTFALPAELTAYFRFRQDLFLRRPRLEWPESRIAAQFIMETEETLPDERVRSALRAAIDDNPTLDITPILSQFGDRVNYVDGDGTAFDYYKILAEFTRLNRVEMRAFKRLLNWAQTKLGDESPGVPARMVSLNTRTGFVVFPVPQSIFAKRFNALQNFATLAKYDFQLNRQIGVCVGRVGGEVEIDWIFLEHPWQHDPDIEMALASKSPFLQKPDPTLEFRYPQEDPSAFD